VIYDQLLLASGLQTAAAVLARYTLEYANLMWYVTARPTVECYRTQRRFDGLPCRRRQLRSSIILRLRPGTTSLSLYLMLVSKPRRIQNDRPMCVQPWSARLESMVQLSPVRTTLSVACRPDGQILTVIRNVTWWVDNRIYTPWYTRYKDNTKRTSELMSRILDPLRHWGDLVFISPRFLASEN